MYYQSQSILETVKIIISIYMYYLILTFGFSWQYVIIISCIVYTDYISLEMFQTRIILPNAYSMVVHYKF